MSKRTSKPSTAPNSRVDSSSPLSRLSEAKRTELFAVMADGPKVVQELTRKRPHSRTLIRWVTKGVCGVKLQSITVARCRMTSRQWLFDFWTAVEAAKSVAN